MLLQLQIQSGRKYQLLASSDEEHSRWVAAFQKMIEGEINKEDLDELSRKLNPTELNCKAISDQVKYVLLLSNELCLKYNI